jgi:hypothetical protein
MEWIDRYLNDSPLETELRKSIDAENEAFNELPTTVAHKAAIKSLYNSLGNAYRERISAARSKHCESVPLKKLTEAEKEANRALRAKQKEEEFNAMPQEYKDAVNAFNKLDEGLKRKFLFSSQCGKAYADIPNHENPKTTEKDISDLQNILVQDVIDFLNARGLQEVDTVTFHIDGLDGSLKHGQWASSTDSSIRFLGLRDDEYRSRTFIGDYM